MLALAQWYTSALTWTVIGVAAALLVGAATVYVTWAAANPRRVLVYSMPSAASLLTESTPHLADGDLQVSYQGHELRNPYVVSVRVESRSRKDIRSIDFDQGKPLVLDINIPIVAYLGESTPIEFDSKSIRTNGSRIELGPMLIRRRQAIQMEVLADGIKPELSCESPLADVSARPQVADDRKVRRYMVSLVVVFLIAVAGASAIPWWSKYVIGSGGPGKPPVVGMSGGCTPFQVFTQNRWFPLGTAIRVQPSVLSTQVGTYAGNMSISVNGWALGQAAYPTNAPPWNSNVWFHLADGAGWVSFAGVRAAPTSPDPTGVAKGGAPVPTLARCRGVVE